MMSCSDDRGADRNCSEQILLDNKFADRVQNFVWTSRGFENVAWCLVHSVEDVPCMMLQLVREVLPIQIPFFFLCKSRSVLLASLAVAESIC
jgi:hypothetical protein